MNLLDFSLIEGDNIYIQITDGGRGYFGSSSHTRPSDKQGGAGGGLAGIFLDDNLGLDSQGNNVDENIIAIAGGGGGGGSMYHGYRPWNEFRIYPGQPGNGSGGASSRTGQGSYGCCHNWDLWDGGGGDGYQGGRRYTYSGRGGNGGTSFINSKVQNPEVLSGTDNSSGINFGRYYSSSGHINNYVNSLDVSAANSDHANYNGTAGTKSNDGLAVIEWYIGDLCQNIPGTQTTVPEGFVEEDGNCVSEEPLTAQCTNPNTTLSSSYTWSGTASGGTNEYNYTWKRSGNTLSTNQNYTETLSGYGLHSITLEVSDSLTSDTEICQVSYQQCFVDANCNTGEICNDNNMCEADNIEVSDFYINELGKRWGFATCKLYWQTEGFESCSIINKSKNEIYSSGLNTTELDGYEVGPGTYGLTCTTSSDTEVESDLSVYCISNPDIREL